MAYKIISISVDKDENEVSKTEMSAFFKTNALKVFSEQIKATKNQKRIFIGTNETKSAKNIAANPIRIRFMPTNENKINYTEIRLEKDGFPIEIHRKKSESLA